MRAERAGLILAAVGTLVLTAAFVVFAIELAGGDDAAAPAGTAVSSGAGTAVVDDRRFGVALRHPRSWQQDRDRRAIRLASPDRRLGLSITTVASRPAAAAVHDDVERQVLRTFDRGRVLRRMDGRMGGRPARLSAMSGRNAKGHELDILLAVTSSPWRTYAVVTFGSNRASQQVLREAESILASLRFTRPGRG